jgi:hypothetical protein
MIREQKLSPRQIARLFACSASRDRGRVLAVVLVAGATARFAAYRDTWDVRCHFLLPRSTVIGSEVSEPEHAGGCLATIMGLVSR